MKRETEGMRTSVLLAASPVNDNLSGKSFESLGLQFDPYATRISFEAGTAVWTGCDITTTPLSVDLEPSQQYSRHNRTEK